MNNEERDIISQFIARVGGAPQPSGFAAGATVPATQAPPLPPVDKDAAALIGQLFQRYPEAPYRMTQLAFVQEQGLIQAHSHMQQMEAAAKQSQEERAALEAELQQTQEALEAEQQAREELEAQLEATRRAPAQPQAQQPGARQGGFFGGLFGGGGQQAAPPPPPPPQAPSGPWGGQAAQAYPAAQPQRFAAPPPQAYAPPPQAYAPPPPPQFAPGYQPGMLQRSGSGFLGSALTTAAGVAGGMVAGNMLTNLISGHHGGGWGENAAGGLPGGGFPGAGGGSPWGGAGLGGLMPGAGGEHAAPAASPWGQPAAQQDAVDQGTWDTPAAAPSDQDYVDNGTWDQQSSDSTWGNAAPDNSGGGWDSSSSDGGSGSDDDTF